MKSHDLSHLSSYRKKLEKLNTPKKIQDYLESISFNHEKDGETCRSPKNVIKMKEAHCMEGALLACAALYFQKRPMLILSLRVCSDDYDHALALFKENNHWGAISKTNHSVLGFRDPVYRTIRELAMSYFHEYFLPSSGEKTMRGYSRPINLKKFGVSFIDSSDDLSYIAWNIYNSVHAPILPNRYEKNLRKATSLELKIAQVSYENYKKLPKKL